MSVKDKKWRSYVYEKDLLFHFISMSKHGEIDARNIVTVSLAATNSISNVTQLKGSNGKLKPT